MTAGVEQLRAGQGDLAAGQERIERKLDALNRDGLMAVARVDASDGDAGPWSERLAEAKALYADGAIRSALRVWERLIEETAADATASPALRARLHNNVGAVRIELDQPALAVEAFRRAAEYEPGRADLVANLAQAEFLAGHPEAARHTAERALALDPDSVGAWAVRIRAADAPVDAERIPAAVRDAPFVLAARALALADAEAGAATALLREALRRGPRDPQLLILLGESLYAALFPRRASDPVPAEVVAEIARLGQEASSALATTERARLLARALVLEGAAAGLAGAPDRGAAYFQRAVAADPSFDRARFAAADAQLELGNAPAALYLLDALPPADRDALWHAERVRALVRAGRAVEVDADTSAAITAGMSGPPASVAPMLAEALLEGERLDLIDPVLRRLDEAAAPMMTRVFRARVAARRGDRALAEREYCGAAEQAPPDARAEVGLELASYLYREGDYAQAVRWFGASPAWRANEHAAIQYATSALRVGRFDTALEVARAYPTSAREMDGGQPAWAADIQARVAVERDDLPAARTALARLTALDPTDAEARVRYGYVLVRSGDASAAREVLAPLEARDDLDPRTAANLAQLLLDLGRPEPALRQAYAALRRAPDDAEVQQVCITHVFFRERGAEQVKAELFTREEVTPDTWVSLRAVDGEALAYLILARGPSDIQRNELLADDPRAAAFLGRKVGDEVTVRPGAANEKRFRVVELKSAMLHTFHEAMLQFQTRFPGKPGLQSIHVGEGDAFNPDPLLRALVAGQERGRAVLALYRERRFPVGAIADLHGRSLLRTYLALLHTGETPVYVEEPSPDALEASLAAARMDVVVLTATGLSTLQAIGSLDLLDKLYPRRLAPQSLVDELAADVAHWEEARAHGGYLNAGVSDDHRFTLDQVSVEGIDAVLRDTRQLHAVVLAAEVLPRPLSALTERQQEEREAVGASSIDAAALARDGAAVLHADDWGLRNLARFDGGVVGCSTYALLRVAHERGFITEAALHRHVARLVAFRHTFIPVDVALLYQALADRGFQVDPVVLRLLDVLADPAVTLGSAADMAVGLVRALATSSLGHGAVAAVTTPALDRLATGRDLATATRAFAARADAAFELLPRDAAVIGQRVQAFVTAKQAGTLPL